MSEIVTDVASGFSTYEVLSAGQFIQAYEVPLAGEPGMLKAEFEDFCTVELGIPTRELARELWDTAKAELSHEQSIVN